MSTPSESEGETRMDLAAFEIGAVGSAAARGVCYNRVGELLLGPDDALFQRLADGSLLEEVERVRHSLLHGTCTPGTDTALDELKHEAQRAASAGLPALSAEYETTFGHAAAVDHPPHEMHYSSTHHFQQVHDLSDVCGFYRAFGVDVPANSHERADHLGIELEFFGLLCMKEASALRAGDPDSGEHRDVTHRAQRRFLAEHLSGFVPTLHRRVADSGRSPFYGAALRFASELVEEDCLRLGIPSEERRRHRFVAQSPPAPGDDDCFGCPVVELGKAGGDS